MLIPCFGGFAVEAAEWIGTSGRHNDTGANLASYQLSIDGVSGSQGADWSGGAVQAGDLCLLMQLKGGTTGPNPPTGFSAVATLIARLSSTIGENYRMLLVGKVLDATDISNGYIELLDPIPDNNPGGLVIIRGVTTVVEESPTNFQRAGSLNANSVAIARPTASKAGIALSVTCRGGGLRTTTPPAGFTNRGDVQHTVGGAGMYSIHFATAPVAGAGQIAAGTSAFDGAADLTVTNLTVVVE